MEIEQEDAAMRKRFVLAAVVAVAIGLIGIELVRFGPLAARAQYKSNTPILVDDVIREWCPHTSTSEVSICTDARFDSFEDGAIHVVFGTGLRGSECLAGIKFADGVTGYAYIVDPTTGVGATVPISDVSSIPATGMQVCEFVARRTS